MTDKDYTQFNIKTFDIVLSPPFGLSSFTNSITILKSRRSNRMDKIKNILKTT
jgi:hypothetical protein